MHQSPAVRNLTTQATQTSPKMMASPRVTEKPKQGLAASQHPPNAQKQPPTPSEPVKKPRRQAGKEYLLAARQRRHAQQFKNYHTPPAPEDIWICEFCEYERIFGSPPRALIRQYEIKDRRAKKQEAEKRRLLEKAKMKGRKKKGNKAAPKPSQPAHNPQQPTQQPQPASMNPSQSQSQGTQSEDYYEEEYDDEYAQDDPPPPSPVGLHTVDQRELTQPATGKQSDSVGDVDSDTRVAE
jgi:hypothetical protein